MDLEMVTSVPMGREEIHLQCTGRIEALNVQAETAKAYDERIREFLRHPEQMNQCFKTMRQLVSC